MADGQTPAPAVVIIEDDADVRESLNGLFRSVGLAVEPFASVLDYLASGRADRAGCMVLDVRLPGKSGLEFYEEMAGSPGQLPVIFISGHADVAMSVRAMKAGAVEFLTKPVRDQDLLDAVQAALERDRAERSFARNVERARNCRDLLTQRERDVMALVVTGLRNKQIAAKLGLSEATIKVHRGNLMQKMQAQSLIELVRICDLIDGTAPIPFKTEAATPKG
jgi:FixJ family two-component response regulator